MQAKDLNETKQIHCLCIISFEYQQVKVKLLREYKTLTSFFFDF